MSLGPGTTLGRYVIESPLGAGGMGDVYLAEDTGLHRRVALKLLSGALAADDTARKRLVREAQAAAGLDHPNICTIYEVGEADGHSFIAMQYVDGETLAERLKRGPLDLPSAIALARQVAEALAEAHRLGIVHRDIKPQNIMLTRSGQAKVLDFGIAKTAEARGTDLNTASALTVPGLVPGTTSYMSPEQARGEPVDQRSDIFSFGIVLFEMASRAHPFAHASSAETASAILTKDPAVSDIAAPAELRRILRKCLEKDCERRYQTMRDLVIDLENLARDLTAPAAAASRPRNSRLGGGPRRSRRCWRWRRPRCGSVDRHLRSRSATTSSSPTSPIRRRLPVCPPTAAWWRSSAEGERFSRVRDKSSSSSCPTARRSS